MLQRRGKKLGEILLSQGLVTEDQLNDALMEQRKSGKALGAVLVEMGALSPEDLNSVLGEQISLKTKKRIGELCMDQGLVTIEQVNQALDYHKEHNIRMGEAMVKLGFINDGKLVDMLSAQLDVPHVLLGNIAISQKLMETVPEDLCKKYKILPIYEKNGLLTIAMADPTDLRTMDHLKFMTGREIDAVIASEREIITAITRVYENSMQKMTDLLGNAGENAVLEIVNDDDEKDALSDEEGMQIVKLVNLFLHEAIEMDASDVHLEPTDSGYLLRYRIDGDVRTMRELPLHMRAQIISRLKIQAGMDIAEKRKPQDGRIKIRHQGRNVDLRVSSFPAVTRLHQSEKFVMRIIDAEGKQFTLVQLGFTKEMLDIFERLIGLPDGIILVTGPTGSGKSSTLYASLKFVYDLTEGKETIITMEDPVESSVEGITQGQINPKAGFTFAAGMRAILRQDPDIIMIGEMRDKETAEMAVQAALTGHVVFSTLHTNDSPSAYTRLLDMGIAPFLIASTVRGILAQRLVRRICSNCKEEYVEDPEILKSVGLRPGVKLYRGKGCPKCENSGYKGRAGLYELLVPDRAVQKLVVKGAESEDIKEYLVKRGDFVTLQRDGLIKALQGVTTVEQVLAATQEM